MILMCFALDQISGIGSQKPCLNFAGLMAAQWAGKMLILFRSKK